VASVAIEVHRRGSAAWHPLPVLRNGSRFSAPVDDETLAAGTYDIRARAVDGAGNERTTAQDGSGKAATIVLPARLKSSLNVGREVRRGRQLRLDPTTVVPFGSRVRLRGRLTGPGGNPVQNTQVDVWQRSALEGSEFKRLGIVITGPQGGFNFRVPAGTSRIIRFRYAGTALQRGFTRDVRVDVHATTTIGIDSRSAVNGDYVTFRGQLRGRPFPAGGKLVELQVFTRRRWRTFAQPRASSRTGRWSFAYRFEAISGSVTFRFRARIRREAVYPYETGTSRQIRVRVRGL
jgi:hypothetical protein